MTSETTVHNDARHNGEAGGAPARTVVVTGASRGIGAAVATALALRGEHVVGLSRTGTAPDGVLGLVADVTDPQAVERAVATALAETGSRSVDVLVAAAGTRVDALAMRTSDAAWDEVLRTNLTGSFHAARAVLPGMLRARRGSIVLVSSVVAARGATGLAAYGASKGGVEGLTRSLAREVARRGVTVNAVAPGFVTTDMTASLGERARADYLAAIPAGRFATVEEVVGPVIFLASPEATYVTGTVLAVDGGMGMGR